MKSRITGPRVLLMLVAFFGVIIAVNVVFIVEAVGTFSGEDKQDPYLQGIDYNHTIAEHEAQAKLGWRATIDAGRDGRGLATMAIAVRRDDGTPVTGLRLAGLLRHPADQHLDKPLTFAEAAPGRYVAQIARVRAGAWDAIIRAKGGVPFEAARRLWLP
jgi:nitrogen fixation protein FixH